MNNLQFPSICGSCGKAPAQGTWEFIVQIKRASAINLLTIFVGIAISNVYSYRIPIAVCNNCKARLVRDARIRMICARICLGIAVAYIVLYMAAKALALSLVGAVFLVILASLVIVRLVLNHNLGSFNGKYFRFKNHAYQDEFAELNPALVKPKRG